MRYDLTLPDDAKPGRFGVYSLFDEDGALLYIGLSGDLPSRLRNHRNTKPWWKWVRTMEWTACDGPTEARKVEKELIATHRPWCNTVDKRPLPRRSRQVVPENIGAKLVELHEAEVLAGRGDNEVERDLLNCYLAALREVGWCLEPLGLPINMSRERVRQRAAAAPTTATTYPVVPPPPTRKAQPEKKFKPVIPPADLAEMKRLQADARRVNGLTPLGSPLRAASERYTELLAQHHGRGVSIYRIAKQLGVTHLAIRARLARHGYSEPLDYLPGNTRYGTPHPLLKERAA